MSLHTQYIQPPGEDENALLDRMEARIVRLEREAGRLAEAEKRLADIEQTSRRLAATYVRQNLEYISRIFPKDRTVVFSGREYFGDNVKYAFLSFQALAKAEGIGCWFHTDEEWQYNLLAAAGLPCLPWYAPDWTAEHMRIALGAKVVVLSNSLLPLEERRYVPYAALQGARSIQLWHGTPVKAVGLEFVCPASLYDIHFTEMIKASGPFDTLVAGAAAAREEWARRFVFHNYAALGSPRNDVLFREPAGHDLINVDIEFFHDAKKAAGKGTPVILYAPTFRDHKNGVWFESANMESFAARCAAKGWLFGVNLHPSAEGRWIRTFRSRYPDIRFVAPHSDIYPILRHVDVLVTDYSSLAFDYLLLDRPVVFYRPDHEEYVRYSRSLVPDAAGKVCGDVAKNIPDLAVAVDAAVAFRAAPAADTYRTARQALRRRFYDHIDGNAGQRLNRLIMDRLNSDCRPDPFCRTAGFCA